MSDILTLDQPSVSNSCGTPGNGIVLPEIVEITGPIVEGEPELYCDVAATGSITFTNWETRAFP